MPKNQIIGQSESNKIKTSKQLETILCPVCKKEIRKKSFRRHLKTHDQSRVKSFHCECGKSYYEAQQLREHKLTHLEPQFECGICGTKFKRSKGLSAHMKSHSEERPYHCNWSDCNQKFKDKSGLNKHLLTHSKTKLYTCTLEGCGSSFARSDQLIIHLKRHEGNKNHFCSWENCTFSAVRKSDVSDHYKTHTKPFVCTWPECFQNFSNQQSLTEHICSHTGVKPFICDYPLCTKSFARANHLTNHINACHLGIKNHKCNWPGCEYISSRKEHIKNHYRIHTGEKPFVCPYPECGQTFGWEWIWREHNRIYHLGKCVNCIASGHSENHAPFVHFKFANERLCLSCAQFKYGMEAAFRVEYHLANYIQNRFSDHPQVRQIIFNKTDPDDQRCSSFRPDVRILTHTMGDAIIECDENSHKPYMCTMKDIQTSWADLQLTKKSSPARRKIKEDSRLSEIVITGTIEKTIAWRFNPDRYLNEHEQCIHDNQFEDEFGNILTLDTFTAREQRFKVIGDDVQKWLDGQFEMDKLPFIHVIYYFYDGPLRQESFVPVDGDEYQKWLAELQSQT